MKQARNTYFLGSPVRLSSVVFGLVDQGVISSVWLASAISDGGNGSEARVRPDDREHVVLGDELVGGRRRLIGLGGVVLDQQLDLVDLAGDGDAARRIQLVDREFGRVARRGAHRRHLAGHFDDGADAKRVVIASAVAAAGRRKGGSQGRNVQEQGQAVFS